MFGGEHRAEVAEVLPCARILSQNRLMEESFLVKSSGGEPYSVLFEAGEAGGLRVFCSCPAGVTGMHCKHKLALMENDPALLVEAGDAPRLAGVIGSVEFAALRRALAPLEEDLARIGREIEALKRAEKAAKANIGNVLRRGVKA